MGKTIKISLATIILVTVLFPHSEAEIPISKVREVWAENVVTILTACESGGRNVSIIDSNGLPSRGILQFQDSTWADFSKKSGIVGDPMVPEDAIEMARWGVSNGYLKRWSCYVKVPETMRKIPEA